MKASGGSCNPVLQNPSNAINHNRYAYCLNNPLRYTDPSGKASESWSVPLRAVGPTSSMMGYYNPDYFGRPNDYGNGNGSGGTYFDWVTYTYRNTYSLEVCGGPNITADDIDLEGSKAFAKSVGEYIKREYQRNAFGLTALGEAASAGSGNLWDKILGKGTVPYDGKAFWGTNFIGPGLNENPYTLKDANGNILQPKDLVDAAAQVHDYRYWVVGASGVNGAFFNVGVRSADGELANSSYEIMQAYGRGEMDRWTGQQISERTYNMARAIYYLFKPITIYKTVIYLTPNHR